MRWYSTGVDAWCSMPRRGASRRSRPVPEAVGATIDRLSPIDFTAAPTRTHRSHSASRSRSTCAQAFSSASRPAGALEEAGRTGSNTRRAQRFDVEGLGRGSGGLGELPVHLGLRPIAAIERSAAANCVLVRRPAAGRPFSPSLHDLAHARAVERDDRRAGRHRLGQHHALRLGLRAEREHVHRGVGVGQVLARCGCRP